jgi:hypothetical protein
MCALGLRSPAFTAEPPRRRKVVVMVGCHQCLGQVHPAVVILTCLLDGHRARITSNAHDDGGKGAESEGVCHEKVDAKTKRTVQCM